MRVDLKDGRLRKGYQILWMDEKTKSKNKICFDTLFKKLVLFLGFDF
jgi:hypothetical protein